ncbi:MAG: hypothetical protein HDT43_00785 [Ruminococcaceae bacterium]|nr:hypothetical protein [Oscillospiraceae bacterium]
MKAALKLNGVIYEVEVTDEQAKRIEETNEKFVLVEKERRAVLNALDENLENLDALKSKVLSAREVVAKAVSEMGGGYEFSDEEMKTLYTALSAYGLSLFTQSNNSCRNDETVQSVIAKLHRIIMNRMGLGSWGLVMGSPFNCYGGCAT